MKKESITSAKQVYEIESQCIEKMLDFFDETAFSQAVEYLKNAPRIGCTGCGHSGIAARHFAHLMCCCDRPARFLSPAEAVHGGLGFLEKGDVLLWTSRGGKTDELFPIVKVAREKGVTVIGKRAFYGCGFTGAAFEGPAPAVGVSVFSGGNNFAVTCKEANADSLTEPK